MVKVEKISNAVEVERLREFQWNIERGSRSLTLWEAWGELPSFLVPCINSALVRRGLDTINLAVDNLP